jgi:hypothetical protein
MVERLVVLVETLIERMANVELALGSLQETKKHEQDDAPTGTALCGSLYRRGSLSGDLTILKNYTGVFTEHDLLVVTCDAMPSWQPSIEWARGEERSWVDDAVEVDHSVKRMNAVRRRCLALLEAEKDDPHNLEIICKDVGLDGELDMRTWWFRTAVMKEVPEVRDLVGNCVFLKFHSGMAGSIEEVVRVVDRIFDLCTENISPMVSVEIPRTPTIEVQIIDWSLTELAAAKAFKSLGERELKDLWNNTRAERRERIKTTAKCWTDQRHHMTPDQRLVDDLESFVSYELLMDLLENA